MTDNVPQPRDSTLRVAEPEQPACRRTVSTEAQISVVIPTRNRTGYLQEALRGLEDGHFSNFEVLVMDQSDDTSTEHLVAGFDERFKYHRVSRRGACPARNLGAALASADLIAFTDDDVVPNADWLERIVASFSQDPALEFIFGQLKAPPNDGALGWFPETLPPADIHEPRQRRKIACIGAGANMSCRKSFLRRVGGFDEVLGRDDMYTINSDAAMAYKAYRFANWKATAEIEVVHKNGFRPFATLRALFDSYSYELGANYARFARRGDYRAAAIFLLEQWDIVSAAVISVARLRRPRRLRAIAPYVRGFIAGLRASPDLGYVDGPEFQRIERDGTLDAQEQIRD